MLHPNRSSHKVPRRPLLANLPIPRTQRRANRFHKVRRRVPRRLAIQRPVEQQDLAPQLWRAGNGRADFAKGEARDDGRVERTARVYEAAKRLGRALPGEKREDVRSGCREAFEEERVRTGKDLGTVRVQVEDSIDPRWKSRFASVFAEEDVAVVISRALPRSCSIVVPVFVVGMRRIFVPKDGTFKERGSGGAGWQARGGGGWREYRGERSRRA